MIEKRELWLSSGQEAGSQREKILLFFNGTERMTALPGQHKNSYVGVWFDTGKKRGSVWHSVGVKDLWGVGCLFQCRLEEGEIAEVGDEEKKWLVLKRRSVK